MPLATFAESNSIDVLALDCSLASVLLSCARMPAAVVGGASVELAVGDVVPVVVVSVAVGVAVVSVAVGVAVVSVAVGVTVAVGVAVDVGEAVDVVLLAVVVVTAVEAVSAPACDAAVPVVLGSVDVVASGLVEAGVEDAGVGRE